MNRKLLWLLSITTMFSAGSVYYAQPLLGDLSRAFGVPGSSAAMIPVLTQSGYVFGLLFLTPLGDILEKRRFLLALVLLQSLTLLGASLSKSFLLFEFIAFAIGISSVLVQVIFPLVASLSSTRERAKNLGMVISSALIGILLSRAVSGLIAAHLGWRAVYSIASAFLVLIFSVLLVGLPEHRSATKITYPKLIYSLFEIFVDLPALRVIALNGALLYAALSAFWASLIFYLESDTFHLGAQAAGAFGVIGAVGAASANSVGKWIDRYGSKTIIQGCMALMALSFGVMGFLGGSYVGLIAGVVILDIGAQAGTVTNQNELYSIHATAQTRLNTIYKAIYFIGGASGSAASAIAWRYCGWSGVCWVGFGFIAAAALCEHRYGKRQIQKIGPALLDPDQIQLDAKDLKKH